MDRRYDIDWIRVIVLGLLIVYHAWCSFMPFAKEIYMPQNKDFLMTIGIPMSLINIWRIPLLFMISGMGMFFAMQRRSWKEMIKDRNKRIGAPMVFGLLFIGPLVLFLSMLFYKDEIAWYPHLTHLWFLLNVFVYFYLLLPITTILKNKPNGFLKKILKSVLSFRLGIYVFSLPFLLEALVVNPQNYPSYANSLHGWALGIVCFSCGYIFVSLKDIFWNCLNRVKSISFFVAISLYLYRLLMMELWAPNVLIAFESFNWMISILGFSARYLNQPSRALKYLSAAVYPVYIVHMPIQYFFCLYILPLSISALTKFILIVFFVFGVSFIIYDFMIKRVNWLRPLFGMKMK